MTPKQALSFVKTNGITLEAFWMPIQYLRIGVQYTAYGKFNGASKNYDGFGRTAHQAQ